MSALGFRACYWAGGRERRTLTMTYDECVQFAERWEGEVRIVEIIEGNVARYVDGVLQ